MFGDIATFLVDTVVTFIVFLLLARFLLQWLRVPFRNPVGEFLLATTNWIVVPARRLVPGVARTDWATLLLAWILQALGIWLQHAIAGRQPSALAILAVALVDLVRFGVYILVFAVIVQVVFSWVNPYAPLAPVFDAITRPFLRPIRRYVPPIGSVDLSPAILFIILQVLLLAIRHVAVAAAGL